MISFDIEDVGPLKGYDAKYRFYDVFTGRYFTATYGSILAAALWLNHELARMQHNVSLNDFYSRLGVFDFFDDLNAYGWDCQELWKDDGAWIGIEIKQNQRWNQYLKRSIFELVLDYTVYPVEMF